MKNNSEYDVIIIGARIAGSILATLLGKMGHRVLVLDRSTFPSDTLSTHFFRAPALRVFKKIGVYEEVQSVTPHLTINFNVVDGIVFPEPVDRPEDYPFYMCVRRIILDDILVKHMKQTHNVEFREGVRVTDLLWNNNRVTGIKWEDSNRNIEVVSKVVVGADGLNSIVAKKVNAQSEHQEPINRAMYYAYYQGIDTQAGPAAEFHYNGNTLVYCFPCDNDLTLLAVSIPISQFSIFKKNPETEFQNVIETMSALAPRLRNAERIGAIKGTGSIPGYFRIPYGNGWALVGDAGMVMDPWSGQGIDQASSHAVFLAKYLDEFLCGKKDWETAMQAFQ